MQCAQAMPLSMRGQTGALSLAIAQQGLLHLTVRGAAAVLLRAQDAADVALDALEEAHSLPGLPQAFPLRALCSLLPASLQSIPALAQTCA